MCCRCTELPTTLLDLTVGTCVSSQGYKRLGKKLCGQPALKTVFPNNDPLGVGVSGEHGRGWVEGKMGGGAFEFSLQ